MPPHLPSPTLAGKESGGVVEEVKTNVLAGQIIDDEELQEFIKSNGKIVGPSVQRALDRQSQILDENKSEVKRCSRCNGWYEIPFGNPYGMAKLGPDDGRCPNCKGTYRDPERFRKGW